MLLATYNGERFLREQIDSILAQTLPGVTILARDDGSQDGTLRILADYASRLPARFHVLPTTAPTGHARDNFLALLQASTAPYVALADQDDVWLPDKLELEMNAMRSLEQQHGAEKPLLVFTDLQVVDDQLSTMASSFRSHRQVNPRNIARPGRLLMENVLTGCTALLNGPLVRLARSMPQTASMHDWWIALLAAFFGHATYLDRQLVLYRQHENNMIGASRDAGPIGLLARLRHDRCRERWNQSVVQARELLRIHDGELSEPSRRELEQLLRCDSSGNPVQRLAIMLRRGYFITKPQANLATAWFLLTKKG